MGSENGQATMDTSHGQVSGVHCYIRDWDAMVASTRVTWRPLVHPEPSVRCRPAEAGEIPASAHRLLKAVRSPWRAEVTYAKGTPLPGRGRPLGAEVESVVVRFRRDGARGWAAWISGKFFSAAIVDEDGSRTLGAREVQALMKGEPGDGR